MSRLQRHASTLKLLSKAKPGLVKGILKNSDDDLIKCLCECCHNLLKGNTPLSKKEVSRLKKYKKPIRDVGKNPITLLNRERSR